MKEAFNFLFNDSEAEGPINAGTVAAVGEQVTGEMPGTDEDSKRENLHLTLSILGMYPGVGAAADVLDGILYAGEGDFGMAGLSFFAAVPFVGDLAAGSKLASHAADLAKHTGAKKPADFIVDSMKKGDEALDGMMKTSQTGTQMYKEIPADVAGSKLMEKV